MLLWVYPQSFISIKPKLNDLWQKNNYLAKFELSENCYYFSNAAKFVYSYDLSFIYFVQFEYILMTCLLLL